MLSRRGLRSLLFVFVIASLVLAACAQQPAPAQVTEAPAATEAEEPVATEAAEPAETEAAEPAATEAMTEEPAATEAPAASGDRKVATFIWTQEFDTLNPYYTEMWFSSITQQIWACLPWVYDDQNNVIPDLAVEIPSEDNGGISEDGTTITVKLRDDATWSDGEPITSADFKFTYDMVMNDANTVSSRNPYDLITAFETPDEQTFVVTFAEPYSPWQAKLFNTAPLPEHILAPVFEADGSIDAAEWNKAPTVSCGPFTFAEWESGSFTRFVKNENYWKEPAKIDEIFFRFVPDDASQIAALTAGDGDLGTFFAYGDLPDLEGAGIEVIKVFSGYNEGWYLNLGPDGHEALKDENVRKALAYGFDRQTLVTDLLLGETAPAATMWDNTPFIDPSIEAYPYDAEQAMALLDEAGWMDTNGDGTRDKDGTELILAYGTTTREIRQDTQAVVQQQFADLGIGLELLTYDSDIFFNSYGDGGPMFSGELDIMQFSTSPSYPDPDSADFLCSEIPSDENPAGTNYNAFCDEEVDALFKQQASQVDPTERETTFQQITQLIFDRVYWLGVWQDPDLWGISDRLQNVKLSGTNPFFNIAEWEITE